MTAKPELVLYDSAISGNAYKVRLLLSHLGLAFERIEFNVDDGSTRTADFLARNPNGKVPTLQMEDGGFLPESNAILHYLADGSHLLPAGRVERARVLQWMFFEQYSHEPYIAVARAILRYQPPDSPRRAELPRLRERGAAALAVMERQLEREPFFAGARYSIADIALYAYTHCAGDGGFDLSAYPAMAAWLQRVKAQPRHVPMPA